MPGKSHGRRSLDCSAWGHEELDTTERLPFHALEKEMATHSSVLIGRIPWTLEPSGLQSIQSQRSWTRLSNYNNSLIGSESKTEGMRPHYLCFTEFSRHFWWMLQLADDCFWASPVCFFTWEVEAWLPGSIDGGYVSEGEWTFSLLAFYWFPSFCSNPIPALDSS